LVTPLYRAIRIQTWGYPSSEKATFLKNVKDFAEEISRYLKSSGAVAILHSANPHSGILTSVPEEQAKVATNEAKTYAKIESLMTDQKTPEKFLLF
jgi:hypothetical protein